MADVDGGTGGDEVSQISKMLKRYEEESQAFVEEKVKEWEGMRAGAEEDGSEDELAGGMEGVIRGGLRAV